MYIYIFTTISTSNHCFSAHASCSSPHRNFRGADPGRGAPAANARRWDPRHLCLGEVMDSHGFGKCYLSKSGKS